MGKGTNSLVLSTDIKTNQSLPGGDWRCEFAFRSVRATVAFRSGGPVGKIVNTTVCPESAVLSYGRQKKTCATDHAGKLLPLSEPVYCTAVFAQVEGQSAQIQFLHKDGSPVWVWNFQIPWPTVYQNYAFTSSIKAEGDYLCRFKLGDGTTVEKPFRVRAGWSATFYHACVMCACRSWLQVAAGGPTKPDASAFPGFTQPRFTMPRLELIG